MSFSSPSGNTPLSLRDIIRYHDSPFHQGADGIRGRTSPPSRSNGPVVDSANGPDIARTPGRSSYNRSARPSRAISRRQNTAPSSLVSVDRDISTQVELAVRTMTHAIPDRLPPGSSRYYVVWRGRQPGIFLSWAECELSVSGYSRAGYKSVKRFSDIHALLRHQLTTDMIQSRLSQQAQMQQQPEQMQLSEDETQASDDELQQLQTQIQHNWRRSVAHSLDSTDETAADADEVSVSYPTRSSSVASVAPGPSAMVSAEFSSSGSDPLDSSPPSNFTADSSIASPSSSPASSFCFGDGMDGVKPSYDLKEKGSVKALETVVVPDTQELHSEATVESPQTTKGDRNDRKYRDRKGKGKARVYGKKQTTLQDAMSKGDRFGKQVGKFGSSAIAGSSKSMETVDDAGDDKGKSALSPLEVLMAQVEELKKKNDDLQKLVVDMAGQN